MMHQRDHVAKHAPYGTSPVLQQKQEEAVPAASNQPCVPVNDNAALENEADVMGAKAASIGKSESFDASTTQPQRGSAIQAHGPVQRYPIKTTNQIDLGGKEGGKSIAPGTVLWTATEGLLSNGGSEVEDDGLISVKYDGKIVKIRLSDTDDLTDEDAMEAAAIVASSKDESIDDTLQNNGKINSLCAAMVFNRLKKTDWMLESIIDVMTKSVTPNIADAIACQMDELEHLLKEEQVDMGQVRQGNAEQVTVFFTKLLEKLSSHGATELLNQDAKVRMWDREGDVSSIPEVSSNIEATIESCKGHCAKAIELVAGIKKISAPLEGKEKAARHFLKLNVEAFMMQMSEGGFESRNFATILSDSNQFNSCMENAAKLMANLTKLSVDDSTARQEKEGSNKSELRKLFESLSMMGKDFSPKVINITIGTHGFLLMSDGEQVRRMEAVAAGSASNAIDMSMLASLYEGPGDVQYKTAMAEWIEMIGAGLDRGDPVDQILSDVLGQDVGSEYGVDLRAKGHGKKEVVVIASTKPSAIQKKIDYLNTMLVHVKKIKDALDAIEV